MDAHGIRKLYRVRMMQHMQKGKHMSGMVTYSQEMKNRARRDKFFVNAALAAPSWLIVSCVLLNSRYTSEITMLLLALIWMQDVSIFYRTKHTWMCSCSKYLNNLQQCHAANDHIVDESACIFDGYQNHMARECIRRRENSIHINFVAKVVKGRTAAQCLTSGTIAAAFPRHLAMGRCFARGFGVGTGKGGVASSSLLSPSLPGRCGGKF